MKKIMLISCAVMCLILSACRPFTDRPRAVVTPTPVPEATVTPTPVIIEETKQPATATDLVPATTSPTDLKPVPTPEGGNAALNENRQEIPFNCVLRGFFITTPEKLTEIISGPDSSVLIQDEEGWRDYQSKYCPGSDFNLEFSMEYFPDQYLFARISMGAKPTFSSAYDVEKVLLGYDGLSIDASISDICAYHDFGYDASYGSAQYFVCIVAVNSADIPAGVAESMRYVY